MVGRSVAPWRTYLALAGADVVLAALGSRAPAGLRWATKPALMPVLAGALLTGGGARTPLRRWTLGALVLSTVGDVALHRSGTVPFLTGLSAFLGAHLAYTAGFRAAVRRAGDPGGSRSSGSGREQLLRASLALTVPALTALAWRTDRSLAAPVAVYGAALGGMALWALRFGAAATERVGRRTGLGAALFLASDTLIGIGRFACGDTPPALDGLIMATYTAGQGLIVSGVAASPSE